ncbi:MAG: hypothetical protein B7Y35_07265 [Sphingomonadales bacterium 28-64-96]|nr:MAG: hypothetical protein B7Y35_07265 [Sphingomonadales bacterium 28-64-96]
MRTALSLIHRWLGGLVGLGLAILGLSGALLLWKPWWVAVQMVPREATRAETLAIIKTAEGLGAGHVTLPSAEFGVAQAGLPRGGGAYIAHDGSLLTLWSSLWDRPETLLFDLHHHLLMGHTGELISGWLGLAAILFVITGFILWLPTRRTFQWRALPARLTRPAILRHHRDLGVVLGLPILFSAATGALIVLKPLAETIFGPLSVAESVTQGQVGPPEPVEMTAPNWPALLATAQQQVPDGEARIIVWPKAPGGAVQLRLRRPAEWHPNGRTTLWLAGDGTLLMVRDPQGAPLAVKAQNALYPLHATRLSGSPLTSSLRVILTVAGIGLALMGSLAVASFWTGFKTGNKRRHRAA